MIINFFEEFPTKQNLEKVKLINFHSEIYIAAKSLKHFYFLEKQVKKLNKKIKCGYWPILDKEDGYWLSPFSRRISLKVLIKELEANKKHLTVMWDAELPHLKLSLFITQFPFFFSNKKLILNFLKNSKKYKIKLVSSENVLNSSFFLTSIPKNIPHKKIIMFYSSMHRTKAARNYFIFKLKKIKKKFPKLTVALGTLAKGILGSEPVLSPKALEKDLKLMKELSINEITLFRLGGLNKDYIKVLKKSL